MRPNLDGIEKKLRLDQLKKFLTIDIDLKEELYTISNGIIVGERNYPRVSVGVITPIKKIDAADNPKDWIMHKYSIFDIAMLRASLIDAFQKVRDINIGKASSNKLFDTIKEIALSYKPIEIEAKFKDKPKYKPVLHVGSPPLGGVANLQKLWVANPKVPLIAEKVVYDTDLNAEHAIIEMHKRGLDEYYSYKLLSLGLVGRKINRKIVPTRWSITAIDDMLAKNMLKKVRHYSWIDNYHIYFGGILGNYYIALFIPSQWSYELFESYLNPTNPIITDYVKDMEWFFDRTTYAKNTAGGYYAARLSIVEKLFEMKKQASILLIRIITPAYIFPLGVWVVREAVRKCMQSDPIIVNTKKEAIEVIKQIAKNNLGADISNIINESKLLKIRQSSLIENFNIEKF